MTVKAHDPAKPVDSEAELTQLLRAGLYSGMPKPISEADWEALRRRALADIKIHKSGESTPP
jgi:hypothetical protein